MPQVKKTHKNRTSVHDTRRIWFQDFKTIWKFSETHNIFLARYPKINDLKVTEVSIKSELATLTQKHSCNIFV